MATFTTDKAMVQAELRVYLGDDPDVNQFTENADNADPTNNTFEFVYEITGEEGEGTKAIKAFLKDNNGNANTVDLGTVDLDFTPPTISELVLADDTPLKRGAAGKVLFTLSEAAALEVTLSNGAVLVRNDAIEPPSYEYSYTVTDNDEESETPLVATVTATDVAGNASSASLDFNAFDFTPPVLLDSNLNHLLLRSGEIFRVTFDLNEPSVTVPEMVAVMEETTIALVGEAVGDTGWSFRHTVLEGQDGTYALTLQNVSDAAGNAMAAVDLGLWCSMVRRRF